MPRTLAGSKSLAVLMAAMMSLVAGCAVTASPPPPSTPPSSAEDTTLTKAPDFSTVGGFLDACGAFTSDRTVHDLVSARTKRNPVEGLAIAQRYSDCAYFINGFASAVSAQQPVDLPAPVTHGLSTVPTRSPACRPRTSSEMLYAVVGVFHMSCGDRSRPSGPALRHAVRRVLSLGGICPAR